MKNEEVVAGCLGGIFKGVFGAVLALPIFLFNFFRHGGIYLGQLIAVAIQLYSFFAHFLVQDFYSFGAYLLISAIPFWFSSHSVQRGKRPLIVLPWAKGGDSTKWGENVVRGSVIDVSKKKVKKTDINPKAIRWGEAFIPFNVELQHILLSGSTGSGKTQAIEAVLRAVRERRQLALIADPSGSYFARFGREQDLILNPFDSRSVAWSPFAEIKADYDYQRLAKSAIPDAEGDSKQWNFYAQTLLTQCMKALKKLDKTSLKDLLYYLNSAAQTELRELLEGTPAAILTDKDNAKMLSNTRAIISVYLSSWEYLPDDGTWSIRDFIRIQEDRWLFLTYRDDQMELLKHLIGCWIDLAIVEGLSLPILDDRRFWYVMDELDSLGRVSSLRAGLTKLRKFGGVVVAGIQTIAQLRSTYGRDEAQSLLSCLSTKLVLRAGDSETAKYFEQEIGQQEVARQEISSSVSTAKSGFGGSDGETTTVRYHTQAAVLASELTGLSDLNGYLILHGYATTLIELSYQQMMTVNEPFLM